MATTMRWSYSHSQSGGVATAVVVLIVYVSRLYLNYHVGHIKPLVSKVQPLVSEVTSLSSASTALRY